VESIARRSNKKISFFIVGDGPERKKIESRIESIDLPQNIGIRMTSWIKDIGAFNAGMDIMCLTSDNEGTPVSLIEAQAANIPIISTDVGGVRDIIEHGETGYVVPKRSPDEFAEKLLLLIEDEKKRKKMSQNGWNFVEHKFHYMNLVKNMESYYHKLLKETLNDEKK